MEKEVYKKDNFRILEVPMEDIDIDELKGDCFKKEFCPELSEVELFREERDFESKVFNEGVYGYVLEKWDGSIGQGWTYIDSCFGFIGKHSDENHYIVDEFINILQGIGQDEY